MSRCGDVVPLVSWGKSPQYRRAEDYSREVTDAQPPETKMYDLKFRSL